MQPRVSVIVPTYNRASFISAAIDSALSQGYENLEIVVVDDGSTDHTQQVLSAYEGQVRYIYQENQGEAVARNTGIAASSGEFIAFLDSDDIWLPNKLTKQVNFLMNHPEIGMVASHALGIDQEGNVYTGPLCPYQGEGYVSVETNILRSPLPIDTLIVRRECLPSPYPFTPGVRFGADWEMCLRVGAKYPIWFIAEPLAAVRFHGGNITAPLANQQRVDAKLESRLGVINRIFSELPIAQRPPIALRAKAEAGEYAEAAMGTFLNRNYALATERLAKAMALHPERWRASDDLLNLVLGYATAIFKGKSAQDALVFLSDISQYLPAEYNDTRRIIIKAQAITEIFTIGFDLYRQGYPDLAISCIVRGLARQPGYVANLGVQSVLARSLFAAMRARLLSP